MNTEQLYVRGQPFYPETNYEKDEIPKQIEHIHAVTEQMQNLINEIVDRVTNQLLEKTEIAEWAKQQAKPSYTAAEVGADAEGNAAGALSEAKDYADDTYIQATGYADQKIAELINGAPSTLDTIGEIAAAMLEHEGVIEALEAAIGNKASEVEYQAHTRNSAVHVTASKQEKWDGYEAQIAEVFQSVSEGKNLVASAVTDKGVATAADAEFKELADNIRRIQRPAGNAGVAQVLAPYTFSNASAVGVAGTMPNKGAVTATLNAGGSYVIPAGYHNGAGKITANSLASQTAGTAAAAHILAGMIAWVKGIKITGAMTNRGAVNASLNAGGSYTIPAGYHNGAGKVTGNSLANQTAGTAAAADITNGKTAWVGGKKITGTQKLGDKAKAVTWYLACEGRRDGKNTNGEDTRYGWISWFSITSLLPDYKSLTIGRDFFVIPAHCSIGAKISLPFGRQVNISSGIDTNNWRASHDLENEKHYLTAENRTGGITVMCLFAPSVGKVYVMTSVNGYIGNIAIIR